MRDLFRVGWGGGGVRGGGVWGGGKFIGCLHVESEILPRVVFGKVVEI